MDLSRNPARRASGSLFGIALLVTGVAALTILTVWAFQHAGYVPCELCLLERNPFYVAVPLGLTVAVAARVERWRWTALGFGVLAALFLVSAGLAAYHTGVEWKVWAGPTGCSGPIGAPAGVGDFLRQLETTTVVRCDAPALVIFGLSLAGWNVLVSLGLAALAGVGFRTAWAAQPSG